MKIPAKMKACLLTAVNKFEIREVPVPELEFGEVLCRIRAVAICGTDPEIVDGTHLSRGWPPQYPFIMGHEWSGEIVKVGPGVTGFQAGDRVAGEAHKGCGICSNCVKGNYTICLNYGQKETGHRHYGFTTPGANCEYNAYSLKSIKKIPHSLSFAHASLVDTAGVALHGIKLIGITPGGTVAIYGPGPIGLCALQIARGMGAKNVILVGRGHRLKVAREIGADFVVDMEKEDPVARILDITGRAGADEILECSGALPTPIQCIRSVRKGGKICLLGFYEDPKLSSLPMTQVVLNEITIVGGRANPNVSEEVIRLFEKGILNGERIVTHRFPLEKYEEAFQTFVQRKEGAIKVVVEP
ncbi:MAG TPA: alcohol dehydrogenase catalytic domain-containing protein [Thermodesulfobacteriota bacterium]|nr:alcohol dehydrogenase catalytic domain-containing protein [Thermodesulfobacteriota bacterium]